VLNKPELLRANRELTGFISDCPEFAKDLLDLIAEYTDSYFLSNGFSLRMSALIKMMVNPHSKKIYCNNETRLAIEQHIKILATKHGYDYDLFVEIIRKYAWTYHIGYCALTEMVFKEHLFIQNGGDSDVL